MEAHVGSINGELQAIRATLASAFDRIGAVAGLEIKRAMKYCQENASSVANALQGLRAEIEGRLHNTQGFVEAALSSQNQFFDGRTEKLEERCLLVQGQLAS